MLCSVSIPAAAGISKDSCAWVNGPRLQLLHLLEKRLPHRAACAARQKKS